MDTRAPEMLHTPERPSQLPELPERSEKIERAPSDRAASERAAEPSAPLGSLVQDDVGGTAPAQSAGTGIDPKAVEDILEEDLGDIYQGLSPDVQKQFRIVGEQTSRQIAQLLLEVKLQVEKIIQLIRQWLKIIPGVSKFFLEQITKIKMDKLMRLRKP